MPTIDALTWLHGSTPGTPQIIMQGGSEQSALEIDFGPLASGSSTPYLSQFPSLEEKTYTSPPEIVGQGGADMGLHIVVGVAFNTLTSASFNVESNATTAATTVIASRVLTLAQLEVTGAHYYIPVSGNAVLRFLRFEAVLTGSEPTTGTISVWYGPRVGGEQ
jgi:hypothetical protein